MRPFTRIKFLDLGKTPEGRTRLRYVGMMTEQEVVDAILARNQMAGDVDLDAGLEPEREEDVQPDLWDEWQHQHAPRETDGFGG